MERERPMDPNRFRASGDGPPAGDGLNQHRDDIDGLLAASDRVFDGIKNPQQYLHQNTQTGGQ